MDIKELSVELSKISKDQIEIQANIMQATSVFQAQLELAKKKESEIRTAIKESMESSGTKKYEDDYISLTYIAPTTRKTFDSTRFKIERPDEYAKYEKISDVSGSIRIKLKETK